MQAVERQVGAVVGATVEEKLEEWCLWIRVLFRNHQHIHLKTRLFRADFQQLAVGVGGLVGDDEVGEQG